MRTLVTLLRCTLPATASLLLFATAPAEAALTPFSPPALTRPDADFDDDGLTNREEFERGSNPHDPDTDGDGVIDSSDGWPRHAWITAPPLADTGYALLPLGAMGWPSDCVPRTISDDVQVVGYRHIGNTSSTEPVILPRPDGSIESLVTGSWYCYLNSVSALLPNNLLAPSPYPPGFGSNYHAIAHRYRIWLDADRRSPSNGYVSYRLAEGGSYLVTEGQGNDCRRVRIRKPDGSSYVLPLKSGLFDAVPYPPINYQVQSALPIAINKNGDVLTLEFGWVGTALGGTGPNWTATLCHGVALHRADGTAEWVGGVERITQVSSGFSFSGSPGVAHCVDANRISLPRSRPNSLNNLGWVSGFTTSAPGSSDWRLAIWKSPSVTSLASTLTGSLTASYSRLTDGANGFPIVISASSHGDMEGWLNYREGDQWMSVRARIWDRSTGRERNAYFDIALINNRLESPYVHNGVYRDPAQLLPSNWTGFTPLDINNQGVMLGSSVRILDVTGQPIPATQWVAEPVLLVPANLVVDSNRDSLMNNNDVNATSASKPFRFWSNDDDDSGDITPVGPSLVGNADEPGYLSGFWELDGRTPDHAHAGVDGRSDLLDFFPLFLDIKQLLGVLPHTTAGITYKLKQADSALNFVYTNLTRAEAFDYLKYNKERVAYGLPSDQKKAHEAPTVAITATGAALDAAFLTRIKDEADKGVILIEGKVATDKPLRLVVEKDAVEIAEVALNIKISEVEKMYRWVNLRGVTGQSVTRATDLSQPTGYPDSATNGKMFIFVHGYNVNERQSRAWNAEAFKRMWQSGSRAMFTAVSWNGDHSQIPYVGVAPDYWDNITRAFQTAHDLAPIVNGLPGSSKVIAGHSMGNVVSSAAVTDYGMNVTKYLMVDAAVALEAYDTSALEVDAMRHPDWATYTDRRVWPTDWYNLFPTGDGRRGLTWVDRFGNIPNAVNIYSSGEEVLNNNDLTPGQIPPIGPERVWIIQEMAKGTMHLAALLTFDIQGGWGFNSEWLIAETQTTGGPHGGTTTTYRRRTLAEAAALTDDQLRAEPFFRPFRNANFTSPTGGSAAASSLIPRADALGGAIPALSFPAGRNPVPRFNATRNRDLMALQDGWPQERLNNSNAQNRWFHSDIKNIAYVFNRGAWDLFVTEGNLK